MSRIRKRIAVFMAQPESAYQIELMHGINSEAFRLDYDVLLFSTFLKQGGNAEFQIGEKEIFKLPNPELFDAIIVVPDLIQIQGALEYIENNIIAGFEGPVIYVNCHDSGRLCVYEQSDEDFEMLAEHLCSVHGCRRFAVMLGPEGHDHSVSRLKSLKKALSKRNIEISGEDIYYGDFWYNKGEETAEKILSKRSLPDAVMCISDIMAISLVRAFEKRGLSVPGNIIVTGYDSNGSTSDEPYCVTSVSINNVSMGISAVRAAVQRADMEFPKASSKGKLIFSNTCGCPTNVPKRLVSLWKKPYSAYDESSDFHSGFNFMNEVLIGSADLWDMLWKIKFYSYYIKGCSNICLCLCDTFHKLEKGEDIDECKFGYSDTIYPCLDLTDKDIVDLDRSFSRNILYPKLFEPHEKPCSYYFAPLHFNSTTFGYAVIENNDPEKSVCCYLSQWIRNCTIALESLKRQLRLRILYRKFEESTIMDLSTGLYSRNGFNLYSVGMLEKAGRLSARFVLILSDINCLKYINDKFGHTEGDKAIQTSAEIFRINTEIPGSYDERNFRIGGDEFVKIMIGSISDVEINCHIEKMQKRLERFNSESNLPYPIYLSTGYYAVTPSSSDTVDSILSEADRRMFKNKQDIKSRTGFDFKRI